MSKKISLQEQREHQEPEIGRLWCAWFLRSIDLVLQKFSIIFQNWFRNNAILLETTT